MLGRATVLTGLVGVLLAASACNDGPQIASPGGADENSSKNRKSSANAGDEDEDLYDDDGQLREDGLGELASGGEPKKVEYPTLDLHGTGSLSCDGDRYNTLSKYRVTMDADNLDIDFYIGKVTSGSSSIRDRANPKIAEKLGPTNYKRVSKKEREALIKDGFDWAPYAIFAHSASKRKTGENFEFSEAFPIFPLPARASAYDELEEGSKSWKSTVTGGPTGTFTATMTIEFVSRTDDEVTIKMVLTIPEDNNRSIYEVFPVAKEATYTVSTKSLDVRRAHVVNWYKGDDQCKGRPEDISQDYNLCTKTVKDKTDTYTCL